jgi:hypothetical protein
MTIRYDRIGEFELSILLGDFIRSKILTMKLSPKILLVVFFVIASASILDENDTYYEPTFSEIYDQALLEEKQREEVKEVKEEK